MALNSYLSLSGDTQGDIKGSVTQTGREDTIEIYGWNHEVISPRDAASGLPTGKRQHKPLVITKAIGAVTETSPVVDDPGGSVLAMFGWDPLTQSYVPISPLVADPKQGYWILVFGVPSS